MTQANSARTGIKPAPLMLSRLFPAPRQLVFQAWSSADHMKRWFSPEHYTVPEAEIDFRPGGVFNLCMRSPEGQDNWSRGHFVEVVPHDRLSFAGSVVMQGEEKFAVHTLVTFTAEGPGTRLSVRQDYEIFDEAFRAAVEGATEGWRTTLDKLERELERIVPPAGRSVVHGSFTLKRIYEATPAMVFHALTDQAAKARWFVGGPGYTLVARRMDASPGGREHVQGKWESGMVSTFDAVYFDVVPNERLVYSYEMHLDDRKISVSLAIMQLKPAGAGTEVTITEHGAFLDGYDDAGSREHGTGLLLDRLGAALNR